MLINVLKEIANQQTHSYASLAKTLNLETEMIQLMFFNLKRMGYIISEAPGCSDNKCTECPVACNRKKKEGPTEAPSPVATRWVLTEKGKKALQASSQS